MSGSHFSFCNPKLFEDFMTVYFRGDKKREKGLGKEDGSGYIWVRE
jgi:hypothetical protein